MAPTTDPIPTLHDPLAEAASIPAEMVAAALSGPDGTVRVLSGTALEAWAVKLVRARFDEVQQDWIAAASAMSERAVRDATAVQVARWTQQLEAGAVAALCADPAGTRAATTEPVAVPDQVLVRRNLWLPRGLANTFKATASAQGISQQDAFTEALQLWVTVSQSCGA